MSVLRFKPYNCYNSYYHIRGIYPLKKQPQWEYNEPFIIGYARVSQMYETPFINGMSHF
jgi:hypothetical protein